MVGVPYHPDPLDHSDWIALIIAPVAGGMLLVALLGMVVFVNKAKQNRSQQGAYNPQKMELAAPRLELDYMLKTPNEERLI